jgi:hypothetical protein
MIIPLESKDKMGCVFTHVGSKYLAMLCVYVAQCGVHMVWLHDKHCQWYNLQACKILLQNSLYYGLHINDNLNIYLFV